MIQSTLHGRLHPRRQAGSWNIPCTWQWRKVAPPTRSVQVRWRSSGSTAALRCPAQWVPPTWTTLTLIALPPTGQLLSSASQPRMSRAMARRHRSAGFKVGGCSTVCSYFTSLWTDLIEVHVCDFSDPSKLRASASKADNSAEADQDAADRLLDKLVFSFPKEGFSVATGLENLSRSIAEGFLNPESTDLRTAPTSQSEMTKTSGIEGETFSIF